MSRAPLYGWMFARTIAAILFLSAPALAGVTSRKVGSIEILRATGQLMLKGGTAKPNAPRLSYTCTLVEGSGTCDFSVVVAGKPPDQKTLTVTHDDGDLVIAGTCTVSRSAKTFEWDWLDGNVVTLVPGS